MITNKFGEPIYSQHDIVNLVMQGQLVADIPNLTVDDSVDLESMISALEDPGALMSWKVSHNSTLSVEEFDRQCQSTWHMPEYYQQLDIARHVLSLCKTDDELQRVGKELLMFQDRDLFDLLRYLTYLVSVMKEHNIIWGVGRGSSVSSYVLYLLQVHRIDSMFYDLDPGEFLR
jgi:DNA polymerase III alpha subunit